MPESQHVARHGATRLAWFLAAVFALDLMVVLQLHDHPLLQPASGLDTSAYVALAARVRGGDYLLGPGLYFVSPLYAYFLAGALALFGSFTAVRVLQVALGTSAVALIFVAAREWFGTRAAWLAAAAASLSGVFVFYEALLLQTALDPFLTAATLACLALAFRRSGRWFFAAGAAFGLQTLNRPNVIVPAVVALILLIAIRRLRGALLLGAGLAVALAPMVARNAVVAGVWSPLPSHGGLNFYIGNNSEADGTYHAVPGITPNISGQEADARRVAAQALGKPVTDEQASAYFRDLGLRWIRTNPAAAARLFARKLAYVFNGAHIPLNDSYAFYAYDLHTLLAALAVGAWLLIPAGVTGLLARIPRGRLTEYLVWLSFVPAYGVSIAIFFVSDRYRLPLLVPMCIGTGAALDFAVGSMPDAAGFRRRTAPPARRHAGRRDNALEQTAAGRERSGRAVVALSLFTALFVFTNWPLRLDDGRIEERTRMAEQFAADGRAEDADRWGAEAERGNPAPALARFRVGRALLANHQPDAAVRQLERARQLDPDRRETDYALGEALLDAGRPVEAVPYLRQAVAGGVRADVAGFDLARALTAAGDRAGARQALARVTPADARDAASWLALGEMAVRLDAPDLEERFFGAAVAADPANATAHLNLAVACAQQGRLNDARRHAEDALRLKPDYGRARQLLAALASQGRRP